MTHEVELLWFSDCPNHPAAKAILESVVAELAPGTPIREVDTTDPVTAARLRFPGSPTIRVNGRDVAPGFVDPGDYTPRCRLYQTSDGLRGLPERSWIEDALRRQDSPKPRADETDETLESASEDRGGNADSFMGAMIVAAAACCSIPLAAAAGLGLPGPGTIAAASVVVAALVARRRSIGPGRRWRSGDAPSEASPLCASSSALR